MGITVHFEEKSDAWLVIEIDLVKRIKKEGFPSNRCTFSSGDVT